MTETNWSDYSKHAVIIVMRMLDQKIEWPEAAEQLTELDRYHGREGCGKIQLTGDEVEDHKRCVAEKQFRFLRDVGQLKCNRTSRYQP